MAMSRKAENGLSSDGRSGAQGIGGRVNASRAACCEVARGRTRREVWPKWRAFSRPDPSKRGHRRLVSCSCGHSHAQDGTQTSASVSHARCQRSDRPPWGRSDDPPPGGGSNRPCRGRSKMEMSRSATLGRWVWYASPTRAMPHDGEDVAGVVGARRGESAPAESDRFRPTDATERSGMSCRHTGRHGTADRRATGCYMRVTGCPRRVGGPNMQFGRSRCGGFPSKVAQKSRLRPRIVQA